MTISTIRKFTTDDESRVNQAAERFCKRHHMTIDMDSAQDEIEFAISREIDQYGTKDLFYKWKRCFCRALREPYDSRLTVAYGYVGLTIQ